MSAARIEVIHLLRFMFNQELCLFLHFADLKSEIDVRKHQDVVLKTSGDGLLGVAEQPMQDSGYVAPGTAPATPTTPTDRGR